MIRAPETQSGGAPTAELTDSLNELLESHAGQISRRIDVDEGQTRQAIQSASAQLSPRTTNGSGILDHALGDRQEPMAQALSARGIGDVLGGLFGNKEK